MILIKWSIMPVVELGSVVTPRLGTVSSGPTAATAADELLDVDGDGLSLIVSRIAYGQSMKAGLELMSC